jgi:hypothetical protein
VSLAPMCTIKARVAKSILERAGWLCAVQNDVDCARAAFALVTEP